ncbi:MAG: PKD domain-containing protein, partial [Thermoplasmata archaeon]|nr:PKD domain-containing protein [Thermoplasmata archaeon]
DEGLKYEFLVSPGADPSTIRVVVEGHQGLSVADGDLVISTSVGDIVDGGLSVFHEDEPGAHLTSSFVLLDGDTYGFDVTGRDPGRALVIDPWVFSSYLGGTSNDIVLDMEVDADGEVYLAGATSSDDFPTSAGAFERSLSGEINGFVTKLGSDGSTLVFSTYIGGSFFDILEDMDVDPSEDIFLCGETYSTDYPTTAGAYQNSSIGGPYNESAEGFVTKLDAGGGKLDYSTYLGSDDDDALYAMDVDSTGRAYVTGYTSSFNMTTSEDAYQKEKRDDDTYYWDAVVRVLDSGGRNLLYSTYLGGEDDEIGYDIEVNATNAVIVTGYTYSPGFPNTTGAYQTSLSGWWSASSFITKLKPDLSDLHFSTFFGGTDFDMAYALTLDRGDNVTITGFTYSTDLPVSVDAYKTSLSYDESDAFVSTISADGSTLLHSTYLGGSGEEEAADIRIDSEGRFHVVGYTWSNDFPTTLGAVDKTLGGEEDGFYAVMLNNLTDINMGTYVGGSSEDTLMAVVPGEDIFGYFGGGTYSNDLHTTPGAYQTRLGGEVDGFFGKVTFDSIPPFADAGPDVVIDQHETVDFDGSNCSDNIEVANWSWSFDYGGQNIELFGSQVSFTFDDAGLYDVTLRVADAATLKGFDQLSVTVVDITPPQADAGRMRSIDQHENVVFQGIDSTDNVAIVNWTWSFVYGGEDVELYGPDPDFTFDEAGEYNVTLTVGDDVGLSDTDWVTIYVKDITAPTADAGDDIEVDQHETAAFDASASIDNVGIMNWSWSFVYRGVPMVLYGETVEFTFDDAGSYEVSLSVTDEAGNLERDTITVRIVDITPPMADAGEDIQVIQGTTVDFDGTGSADNERIASYNWTFDYQGVPIVKAGNRPSYFFEAAGEYVITLTVSDMEGNSAEDTVTVTVNDVTAPEAVMDDDITIDQGDTAIFSGLSSTDNLGIVSWVWTFAYRGQEVELTGASPTYVFEDAGVYSVDMLVTDAAGNWDEDEMKVTVRDTTPPVAVAGSDREADQGLAVTMDGSGSTDNVGVTLYTWTFEYGGGTEELPGRTVQFPFEVPGDYTITLTATDAVGNTHQDAFDLHVRDTVLPTLPTMGNIETQAGDKVTLDAMGAVDNVGVIKWTWTFEEDGKTVTLEGEKVTHTFETAGDYKVTLTVEDAEGNQATTKFDVKVESSSWLWIVLVLVIVVVVAAALFLMRRGGGAPADEESPEEGEGKTDEIIIEERYVE